MKSLNNTFIFIFLAVITIGNNQTIYSKTITKTLKENVVKPYTLPSSLSGFTYVYENGPSNYQTITLETSNLTTRPFLTVSAPSGFEVSLEQNNNYVESFTMDEVEITSADIIFYIRLKADLPVGNYTGDFQLMAPSANPYPVFNENISLEGTVTALINSWNGSSWSNGSPNENHDVTLTGDYNTGVHGDLVAYNLQINTTATLTINNSSFASVQEEVGVDGEIIVETTGSFIQVANSGNFIVSEGGIAKVNKTTAPLAHWYDYTYWSSPVDGVSATEAFTGANPNRRYWFNAQNFLDELCEVANTNTFTAGHDDIDDNGDDWQYLNNSTVLTPGVGYATSQNSTGFTSGNTYNFTFEGTFNTGTITTPLYYNGDNGDNDWNFIGNPYPSAISADAFFAENSTALGGAIYLWSHASVADANGSGNEAFNFSGDDYAIINSGSGEIAGGKSIIPNRFIPTGQGFFVQAMGNGQAVFNNNMRMADATSNSQFFRNHSEFNKLWVNLTSDNGIFNQVLVAYVDGATNANDGLAYDTPRNLSSDVASILYTTIPGDNTSKYAIQGKAQTSIHSNEIIPLGFYTAINEATIYTLSLAKTQGNFITQNTVYIKDNLMNTIHDLKQSDYNFTSVPGEFNNRFEIIFNTNTLNNSNFNITSENLTISNNQQDALVFKTNSNSQIKNITLYDMLGKQVSQQKGDNAIETIQIASLSKGTYIATILLDSETTITKKISI